MTCHVGWDSFPPPPSRSTRVTWGVFDGVHVGHQAVIDAVAGWARREGAASVVLTFDPHPLAFLRGMEIRLILPVAERVRLIAERGIDEVLVLPFDRALADLPAEAFFADVLRGRLGAGGILIGYDSRFGRGGEGTIDALRRMATPAGVAVRTLEPRLLAGRPVKSSRLRDAIAGGDLAAAQEMMGRPVALVGTVVRGDGRGRTLGYPTANVDCAGLILPPHGVYAVRGRECAGPGGGAEGKPIDGVMNVGLRPTFAGTHVSLEVHFFDLAAGSDLYGRRLHLDVVGRLRGEQRFPDVGALKAQIEADCRAARAVLAAGR